MTGFTTAPRTDRSATLMCLVNPTNPTGDYWDVEEMKTYLEGACDAGTTVIVGENKKQKHHWGGWRSVYNVGQGDGQLETPSRSFAVGEVTFLCTILIRPLFFRDEEKGMLSHVSCLSLCVC